MKHLFRSHIAAWQSLQEQCRAADLPPPCLVTALCTASIVIAGLLVATGWVAAL